jgi:hypothetical protein
VRSSGGAAALFFIAGILPVLYASPGETLGALLDGRGVPHEAGFLFAVDDGFVPGFSGEAAGADERSVLAIFGGGSGEDGEGEDEGGESPCTVVALPLGDGTAEGAFGRRCALGLAEGLSGAALPARVIVAFLGERDLRFLQSGGTGTDAGGGGTGAGGGGIDAGWEEEAVYGLMPYLPDPEHTVFWYLDLPEAPAGLLIRHGSAGRIAPLETVRSLTARCESLGIPFAFANPFNGLFLSGLAAGPAELDAVLQREMAGLLIAGADHTTPGFFSREKTGADRVTELLLGLASSPPASIPSPPASIPPPPVRDCHYGIVSFPGAVFYLSERALILLTLAAGGLCFIFMHVFFRIRGLSRLPPRVFFRCFPIILLSGGILCLSLGLSGLIAAPAGSLVPASSFAAAFLLPCLRPVLGIGLSALFSLPLRRYRLPRRLDLYGAGALFFAALDIFAAALANIVLVPLMTGTFVVLFLGTCFRNPVPVFICALLAPLPGIAVLAFALRSGGSAGAFLLSTGAADTVRMTLALLPFVLMYRRNAAPEKRPAPPGPKKTGA